LDLLVEKHNGRRGEYFWQLPEGLGSRGARRNNDRRPANARKGTHTSGANQSTQISGGNRVVLSANAESPTPAPRRG